MKWPLFVIITISTDLVSAGRHHFQSNNHYEDGHLGEFPVETYKTATYLGPKQNVFSYQTDHSCAQDDLYTLITPRGSHVPYPGPMVLDSQGSLVWTDTQYREPYNLQVQTYKNESYLTFWAGDDGVRGHGQGTYYMLNSSYHLAHTVTGANNFSGDLHEFSILSISNTALLTIYPLIEADLRSANSGPENGWVWDSGFQEINIDTGEALFEWKASEHVPFQQSYATRGDGYFADSAWDWFHVNSVDKDPQGNYLISSRYMHALLYIDGCTGEIIWQLGGKDNMFRDITNYDDHPDFYSAAAMAQQHHARWRDNYTSITLFDNGIAEEEPSIGMWIDIDVASMTVQTRQVYVAPDELFAESQGNMLVMENGNVLLGFGHEAQYTEFTKDGKPLCDVHFGPKSGFRTGTVESYRVEKGHWVGTPTTPPQVFIESDYVTERTILYVSWMGATEVERWSIEGKGERSKNGFAEVAVMMKDGFESVIDLSSYSVEVNMKRNDKKRKQTELQSLQYFRAVALDRNGTVLGESDWFDAGEELLFGTPAAESISALMVPLIVGALIGFIGVMPCLWLLTIYIRRLRKQHAYQQVPTTDQKPGLPKGRRLSPVLISRHLDCDSPRDLPMVSPRRAFVLEDEDGSDTTYDSDGGER